MGDILSGGMGGTTPVNQNTMVAGTAGARTGPTWADAIKAGVQYGSKPGSSGPAIAGQLNTQQQNPLQTLEPVQMMPTEKEKLDAQQGDSLGQILSLLLALI